MSNSEYAAVHRKTWLTHSAAGACSGIFTRIVCQPFDVLKIRFQVSILIYNNRTPMFFFSFVSYKSNRCRRIQWTPHTNLFPSRYVVYSKKKVLKRFGKVIYPDNYYQSPMDLLKWISISTLNINILGAAVMVSFLWLTSCQ